MKEIIEKANILVESLPYIKKFSGKTFVIKYGGHAMENDELKYSFAEDITLLKYVGINPVIVHGGGPQIGAFLKKLDIQSQFIGGMRVTDMQSMEVVEMTLSGKINKEIVSLINKAGGSAIGFSGRDGNLIKAKKLYIDAPDEKGVLQHLDIGLVGEVDKVNTSLIDTINAQFIPVIAPIGIGENYEPYNINADLVAGSMASSLKAEKLMLLTDVDGVKDKEGNRISTIKPDSAEAMKKDGTLSGGMIPKIDCAIMAVKNGVQKAHIIDGRIKHSILLEIFTDSGIGTQILP